jgi:hypothetical protein
MDADNIVPFKQQPMPRAAAPVAGDEPGSDMRLPAFMTRGQAALAAASPAEPGVTVTATERKLSFELPMNDPRIARGLGGLGGLLARTGQAGSAAGRKNPDTGNSVTENAGADSADIGGTATIGQQLDAEPPAAVTQVWGPDRHSALSLPAPIREHERRG